MSAFPPLPQNFKSLSTFMRVASDLDATDPTTAYWVRLYCVQTGLKIDSKSKDAVTFLTSLMDWLERAKKSKPDNESVTNEMVGQAHVENYALQLFNKADTDDREGKASKNTSRQFLIASLLFEVLTVFGELPEDIQRRVKYAKWKAIYINQCLKKGEIPTPGPIAGTDAEEMYFPDIPTTNDNPTDHSYEPTSGPTTGVSSTPSTGYSSSSTTDVISSGQSSGQTPALSSDQSEIVVKARKYSNFAGSALQYEDIPTAIDYLEKALSLLKTGSE